VFNCFFIFTKYTRICNSWRLSGHIWFQSWFGWICCVYAAKLWLTRTMNSLPVFTFTDKVSIDYEVMKTSQWKWTCALRLTSSSMTITHDNKWQCVRGHCSCLSLLRRWISCEETWAYVLNSLCSYCCADFPVPVPSVSVCHLLKLILFTSKKPFWESAGWMAERN
jgi:hypothetical protein